MLKKLEQIGKKAFIALDGIEDESALEKWRTGFLGRKSELMLFFRQLVGLSDEQRQLVGKRANEVKQELEAASLAKRQGLQQALLRKSLETRHLDVTLPGRTLIRGRLHPATQTLRRICHIFANMGFQTYRSRDVETEEYNFQMLNMPPYHPARDMQDTFYLEDRQGGDSSLIVLRTQTSPGQIHAMREFSAMNPADPPPVRIILPGMCYRHEEITTRSEIQFNQVEGLAIGKDITFNNLKATLNDFARSMFGQDVRTRFRASYFPFTEPSGEVDIECFLCHGEGCSVCKDAGWLEILGCGMVNPVVLENGGYDSEKYMGFAFGLGPERIAMLLHDIKDIRYFWANDARFLEQF